MEEKELDNLMFTNVDFATLDKDHVYVFRVKQECIDNVSKSNIDELCRLLQKHLTSLDIKFVILAGDAIEITELVK